MIQEYLIYLRSIKGYSENTIRAYGNDLRTFVRYCYKQDKTIRWSTITRAHIDDYIIHLSNTNHRPATLCRHISSIEGIFDYMKREGYDIANPARYETRPKKAETQPNTIPIEDIKQAIIKSTGDTKLLLKLLATTGIRIQEALDIEQCDIDYQGKTLKIHGKGMKERKVYLTDDIIEALKQKRELGHIKAFQYIDQRHARSEIYAALRGNTTAKQQSPHAIRHTYATTMAQRGMTATTLQKLLGHNQLNTTQKYIDAAQIQIEKEARALCALG